MGLNITVALLKRRKNGVSAVVWVGILLSGKVRKVTSQTVDRENMLARQLQDPIV